MKLFFSLFFILLLMVSPLAQAHYLWLEIPENEASSETSSFQVYYGEYEEGAVEVSGGRLDDVTAIEVLSDEQKLEKKESYFEGNLSSAQTSAWTQIQELDRPVQDWSKYDIGIVKPNYYASVLTSGTEDTLPAVPDQKTLLGIYPTQLGEATNVVVYFKGQPLPKAKVLVHAPNQWTKEWRADEEGVARCHLPWPGLYVFEVIHLEKVPGEFEAVPYEAIRQRATFAFENDGA